MRQLLPPKKPLSEYKRGELALYVLGILALGVLFSGVIVAAPAIGALFKILQPKNNRDRYKIKRALALLEKRKMLVLNKNETAWKITPKGATFAEYNALHIPKQKWDKKWRLVMFDIPETKRPARVALSRKVLDMGMRHVQDSIFISPYPCTKEIIAVANFLGVTKFVQVATALDITNASYFKKEFALTD